MTQANELSDDRHPYGFRKSCEAIREEVPLPEVAGRFTELRQVADKHRGRCPLPDHEDRSPSFYCYPDGRWWCFGCKRGGDVVDLEFHCGDYGELWEAMVGLAVEYDVKLPPRPASWFRRQERQKQIRNGVEEIKINSLRRRLFRLLEPMVSGIADDDERAREAEYIWREITPLAVRMIEEWQSERYQGSAP